MPDGATSQTIKRGDLYRVLHKEATGRGIRVELDKRLVAAQQTGDPVRATFADGGEAVADVLIGCDGIHSTVRHIIHLFGPAPICSCLLTNGGYARGATLDTEPGSYEMIFGKRACFGYATAPDGDVWWFANVPRHDEPARGEVEAVPSDEWRRELLPLFSDDAGPAIHLIGATRELMTIAPIHTMPRLPACGTTTE